MTEPNVWLRAMIWHFGSGDALFTGGVLLLIALILDRCRGRVGLISICAGLGAMLILLSAWPAVWLPSLLLAAACVWLIRRTVTGGYPVGRGATWRWVTALVLLLGVMLELPWRQMPQIVVPPDASLAVLGDSISAGLESRDRTWPRVLAHDMGMDVFDASQQGATVASGRKQLAALEGRGTMLLIELGGNDVLESVNTSRWASDLEVLLNEATERYSTVFMMELPLPPGDGEYGRIQRRLARQAGVPLVPKRYFAGILTGSGHTVDGIHLSNVGHSAFAGMVARILHLEEQRLPGSWTRCE